MPTEVKLPRLFDKWEKQPKLLERYWDRAMTQLEDVLNQILAIPAIEAALVAVAAATAAANAAAANAQNAADGITTDQSLVNSFPTNYVDPLVSSDNVGNVTIANHDRQYGDPVLNPTVAVTGAVVPTTGIPGDIIRIYYNDPTRAGGAVTYLYTIDPAPIPVQTGNVHNVGSVEVPAAGTADGGVVRPPGWSPSQPIP